jgi:hypothetical protein
VAGSPAATPTVHSDHAPRHDLPHSAIAPGLEVSRGDKDFDRSTISEISGELNEFVTRPSIGAGAETDGPAEERRQGVYPHSSSRFLLRSRLVEMTLPHRVRVICEESKALEDCPIA